MKNYLMTLAILSMCGIMIGMALGGALIWTSKVDKVQQRYATLDASMTIHKAIQASK